MVKGFRKQIVESIREVVFGLEDGLVSTLGAVTGIAAGAQSTFVVVLAGLVLIVVESFSMAAGSYLSSKTAGAANKRHEHPIRGAGVMGVFYFLGGLVPLTPYLLFTIKSAYIPSISATAVLLFILGVWSSKYTKRSALKSGAEMVVVSLGAAGIGYLIGRLVHYYFGLGI